MKVQLRQLTPGAEYKIQVRVTDDEATSEWSKQFDLVVPGDGIAPSNPTGLVWATKGTAFEATWVAPTTSADGAPLKDLRDYQVTLSAGATSVTNYTAASRFNFSFEDNYNAFKTIGGAQATVKIVIKARDLTGNLSTGVTATATNPPPEPPTNLVLAPINDAITLSWTGSVSDDVKGYKIYQGTTNELPAAMPITFGSFAIDDSDLRWSGGTTGTTIQTIQYDTDLYFDVTAFDVFGTESEPVSGGPVRPKSSFTIDTDPPPVPTGLAAVITTGLDQSTSAKVSWNAVQADDLMSYQIRYRASGATDWSTASVDKEQTSTSIDRLRPYAGYDFAIRAVDFTANYSAWSGTITASGATNTAPSSPTGVQMTAGGTTAGVVWSANTELDVAFGAGQYEVQIDTVNAFNSANLKDVKTGALVYTFSDLVKDQQYFGRVRAIDSLGLAGPWSAVVTATPAGINGSVIITNTLAGDRVIANTLDANALKANSAIISDLAIKSALTIGDATGDGSIQSYGYVAGTTGFKLTKNTLEINQGSIAAAALKLQTGSNMIPPQYATFIPVVSYYKTSTNIRTGQSTTVAVDQTQSKFANGTSLKITTTTTAQSVTFNGPLNANQDNGNIQVDPGRSYIYSAWVYAPVATNITMRLIYRSATPATLSQNYLVPAGVWTRVWTHGQCPDGITTAEAVITLQDVATINIDAQQVEPQLGSVTTPSPWTPPGITQVDGGVIRTGQIQSTSLVSVNGTQQPAWSINLAGNAQLGNALVRGALIVGTSADADQSYVASANYVPNTSGWAIKSNGFAEFQNVKVGPGQITDSSIGSISASKITTGTITSSLLISGSISTASTGARVEIDADGINAYDTNNANPLSISSSKSSVLMTSTDGSTAELMATNGAARLEMTPTLPAGTDGWTPSAYLTQINDAFQGSSNWPMPLVLIKSPKLITAPSDGPQWSAKLSLSGNHSTTDASGNPVPNPPGTGAGALNGYNSRAALRATEIGLSGAVIRESNYPALFLQDMLESTSSVSVSGISSSLVGNSGMQWIDMGSVVFLQGFVTFTGSGSGTTPIAIGSFPRQFDRSVTRQNFAIQIDGILALDGTGSTYKCTASGTTLTSGNVASGLDRIYVPASATSSENVTLTASQITSSTLINFSGFYFTGDIRGIGL